MTLKASPLGNFRISLTEWRWRRHRSVTYRISLTEWRWKRHRSVTLEFHSLNDAEGAPLGNFRISLAKWRWRRHRSVTGWFERSEYPPGWYQRVVALWKSAPTPDIPCPVRAPLQGAMLARSSPGVLASLARPGYWAETPSASWPSGFSRFSILNIPQNSLTYFYNFERPTISD